MAARSAAGRTRGFVHFFARSARHILVEEGTRSYLTLPTISHTLLNVSSLQKHVLDDQRKFVTFIYIRPWFATDCSTFPKLWHPPNTRIYTNFKDIYTNRTISTYQLKKWCVLDLYGFGLIYIYISHDIDQQSLSICFARKCDFWRQWIQWIYIELYIYIHRPLHGHIWILIDIHGPTYGII